MTLTWTRTTARTAALVLCAAAICCAIALAQSAGPSDAKSTKPIAKPAWLPKTILTEYYPSLEAWFDGARQSTPGVAGRASKIDWLYSAKGMAMEGDGVGTDGDRYHIESTGSGGWIARNGKKAVFGTSDKSKQPFWRSSGYWRNKKKGVTYQLHDKSWFAGVGKRYIPPQGITFAKGPSRPLTYYRSVAVDPKLIPLGSLVWVGKYRSLNGDGWFRADDTGGAIIGHHLDIYRQPPDSATDGGRYFSGQRVYVVPKNKIASYVRRETKEDTDGLPLPPGSLR